MQKSATVAVINVQKKLLILRRGTSAPWMPGSYCLPGGKVEPNEELINCASRELGEETGISYSVDEFKPINIQYKNGYSKTVWMAVVNSDKVILNWEHDDYRWVSSAESSTIDLVPGLRTTIKTLADRGHVI